MIDFSFIVPVYNGKKYLSRCIDSLINQDFDKNNYEIIFINDGSKDNSLEILNSYKMRYPNLITIINQENQGIGKSRNKGFSCAKGQYIWFIDNDDWIATYSLKELKHYSEIVDFDIFEIGFINTKKYLGDLNFTHSDADIKKMNPSHCIMMQSDYPWSKIYKKSFLDKVKVDFKPIYGEDTAEINRWYAYTEKIFRTESEYYAWFNNSKSFSHKVYTEFHYATAADLLKILEQYSIDFPNYSTEYQFLAYKIATELNHHFSVITKKNKDNILRLNALSILEKYLRLDNLYIALFDFATKRVHSSFFWRITLPLQKIKQFVEYYKD